MPRIDVENLSDGQSIEEVYLLADKQLRANRAGDLYLLSQLRDRTGQISGLLWNVNEQEMARFTTGDYVRIRGKVQLYQGNLQIILSHLERVASDTVDPEEFIPASTQDTQKLLERLREILLGIEDRHLRTLMESLLVDDDVMAGLTRAPAGIKLHHAFHGGLLEHIVNVLETAVRIVDLYPQLDPDLLLAGIFLHDLAKVRELSYDSTFSYTDEGQLIGHLVMGIEMINEKLNSVEETVGEPFPTESLLRLKHMVLSHHGSYEFGSPRLPMTPEAIALHHLDNLDAKINEFTNLIESDPNSQSSWTAFSPNIQRKLYKGDR
ncbi:MAG: HD domain-containing protein [Planctomycetota bacterium]|nr:MAG: HD domain-containing protein [Planctomycetota bacterium]REJ91249.1 MAG: HD domain-containing protein [Planctomycetota bacterium]REK22728.1 MAG: HD domain-containing protein [Planctomycetota bacterium]REK33852.1 MAG: HD domain-containing protein [Planctomycetota bacterium]